MKSVDSPAIRRYSRIAIGGGIYRWLVGCAFLFAIFKTYPEHALTVALGYLAFSTALHLLADWLTLQIELDRTWRDRAERKTRHTSILAAELARGNGPILGHEFWQTIEDRLDAEGIEEPVKGGFWRSASGVTLNLIGRIFWDVVGLAIVAILAQ